jgi:hypothetical protein
LVPAEIAVGKFVAEIRKHMKLSSEQGIYLFLRDDTTPPPVFLMSQIYEK